MVGYTNVWIHSTSLVLITLVTLWLFLYHIRPNYTNWIISKSNEPTVVTSIYSNSHMIWTLSHNQMGHEMYYTEHIHAPHWMTPWPFLWHLPLDKHCIFGTAKSGLLFCPTLWKWTLQILCTANIPVSFVFGKTLILGIFFHTLMQAGSKDTNTRRRCLWRPHGVGGIKTNVLCDQGSLSSSCPAVCAISLWHRGGWQVQQHIWSRPMGDVLLIIKHSLNWRKGGHPSIVQRKCVCCSPACLHTNTKTKTYACRMLKHN